MIPEEVAIKMGAKIESYEGESTASLPTLCPYKGVGYEKCVNSDKNQVDLFS